MNKLSLDELEYLYAKFRISCPSDGLMAKRIEAKLVSEINERREADKQYNHDDLGVEMETALI